MLAQAGKPKKFTKTPESADAFWSISMPTASFAARALRIARAKSFLKIGRLPESARRLSTSASINGLSSRRGYDHVHRRPEHRVCEGAELPFTQMRCGEQHTAAAPEPSSTTRTPRSESNYPGCPGKGKESVGEDRHHAGDRPEYPIRDLPALAALALGSASERLRSATPRNRGTARSSKWT